MLQPKLIYVFSHLTNNSFDINLQTLNINARGGGSGKLD